MPSDVYTAQEHGPHEMTFEATLHSEQSGLSEPGPIIWWGRIDRNVFDIATAGLAENMTLCAVDLDELRRRMVEALSELDTYYAGEWHRALCITGVPFEVNRCDDAETVPDIEYPVVYIHKGETIVRARGVVRSIRRGRQDLGLSLDEWSAILPGAAPNDE